jgi:hypothetical protein
MRFSLYLLVVYWAHVLTRRLDAVYSFEMSVTLHRTTPRQAGHGSRAVEGVHCLRSLGSRDHGFESHSGHGCLVFVCAFFCVYVQVEA